MKILLKRQKTLLKALSSLEKSLDRFVGKKYDDYEECRDSLIQRFEFSFDLFWKYLKDYLKFQMKIEVDAPSPRSVLKKSWDLELINQNEHKISIKMIEDRNRTSHAYDEDIAEEVAENVESYYGLMIGVANRLLSKLKES